MSVFVDTSALYAVLDADDPNHAAASSVFRELRERDRLTHNYVAVEATALVERRLGRRGVRDLHERLLPAMEIHWIDAATHAAAVAALLARGARRGVSLVDHASFEVMRRVGVQTAFAFDRDFAGEGFRILP